MNEKDQELTELDLEDILKEFGDADDSEMDEAAAEALKDLWEETEEDVEESAQIPEEVADEEPEEEISAPAEPEQTKPVTGDTIRLDRTQIDEINQGAQRKDNFRKGKKRDEIKPMKKGFSLFGKKNKKNKKDDEDDFIEDLEEDFDDDDFIDD